MNIINNKDFIKYICYFCIIIGSFIIYIILKKFKQHIVQFEQKRKKFVEYLKNNNDIESLKKIGEINMFGKYERWYPNYYLIKQYIEDNVKISTEFSIFLDALITYKKKYTKCLIPVIGLLLIIDMLIVYGINTKIGFFFASFITLTFFIFLSRFMKRYEIQ